MVEYANRCYRARADYVVQRVPPHNVPATITNRDHGASALRVGYLSTDFKVVKESFLSFHVSCDNSS